MNLQKNKKTNYYLFFIIFCIAAYYLLCILLRGRGIQTIFVNDSNGTFMDFFNSIANANIDPYRDGFSNYPAMACLMYKFFMHIVPAPVRGIGSFQLRNLQQAMVVFILFNIAALWIITASIDHRSQGLNSARYLLSLVVLSCAPMVFTIERGNLILLSFALSVFFAFNHDSKNKLVREAAFISLAIAAAIKIYPAILGLIILKQKRFKDVLKLVIYGLIAFIAPFFYYDGIDSLVIMVKALFYTSNLSSEIGYGVNVGLYNICETIALIFGWSRSTAAIYAVYIIVFGILIVGFFTLKKKWQEWMCLCLLIVLLPKTNYYYIMIFLLIPFVEWLNESNKNDMLFSSENWENALLFALFLIPLPLPQVRMFLEYKFVLSYSMLIYYLGLLCACVVIFSATIDQVFAGKRVAKRIGNVAGIIVLLFSIVCVFATLV